MKPPIRGVIFDLDGTLVDSGLDFHAIRREMQLPVGVPILEALAELAPGDGLDALVAILERHEREGAERATLIDGSVELLARLKAGGIAYAVLTRNSRASALSAMQRLALDVPLLLSRDEAAAKPDPAGVLAICRQWGFAPHEVLIVGDYVHDIDCGLNAGTRTMLLARGERPGYADRAEFCVSSLAEAAALIWQLAAVSPVCQSSKQA